MPPKTNEQALAESTQVAQNAAKMIGGSFTQGVGYTPPTTPMPGTATLDIGNLSPTFSSSLLTQTPKTSADIQSALQKNLKAREDYLASQGATSTELDLQGQLSKLREESDAYDLSVNQGQANELYGGTVKPMELATGRAQQIGVDASFKQQTFALKEKNLLSRLGIAQENRKLNTAKLKDAAGFAQEDVDFAVKAEERVRQIEKDVFDRAVTLNTIQRQQLADILDAFKGADPRKLTPQVQAQLAQLATKRGIPLDILLQGMEATYLSEELDRTYKQVQIANTKSLIKERDLNGSGGGGARFTPSQINSGAANAKISLEDFKKLSADDQNYFINRGEDLNAAFKVINKAIDEGESRESVEEVFRNLNVPQAVKDTLYRELYARMPDEKQAPGVIKKSFDAAWNWIMN